MKPEDFDHVDEAARAVLSDLLEELGREEEAQLVRSGPVYRTTGGRYVARAEGTVGMTIGGAEWEEAGLPDGVALECATFVNQSEYGDGQLEGEFYVPDDENCVIVHGSFGNYNSPGCSGCTWAEFYETRAEYEAALAEWEAAPEYLEGEGDAAGEDEDGEGDEPEEGDDVTEDFVTFGVVGERRTVKVADGEEWRDVIRADMDARQFFPEVWRSGGSYWEVVTW